MSTNLRIKYKAEKVIESFFTGNHIQISSDGEDILCSNDKDIKIFSIKDGKPSKNSAENDPEKSLNKKAVFLGLNSEDDVNDTFQDATISADDDDVITALLLSPDGKKLVVAFKSLRLRLYEWPSRTLKSTILCYHKSAVCCLAWDQSSTLVVTGAADGTARVWDLNRNVCTHSIKGVPGVFGCAAFHPNLHSYPILYAGVHNVLYAWKLNSDCSNEVLLNDSDAHHLKISSLLLSEDGTNLVTLGMDRVAILWDAVNLIQKTVTVVGQAVTGAILLPLKEKETGVKILLGGETGYISVWHLNKKAKEIFKSSNAFFSAPQGEEETGVPAIKTLIPSPALDSVVLVSYDNNILFVKTDTLKPWKLFCGNNDEILSTVIVQSPQDKELEDHMPEKLIIAATNSPEIRLYEFGNLNCKLLKGHTSIVLSLSKHPTLHEVFASCSHDSTVRLWHTTNNNNAVCIAVAEGHSKSVASVAFGVSMLVSCGQDQCIKQWNISTDNLEIGADATELDILGNTKSTSPPKKLQCKFTQVGHEKDVNSIAVSKKDAFIATGSRDKTIKLWNGRELTLVKTLTGHKKAIWSVQFSPVDKLLASASADGTIGLWSLQTLSLISILEGHECSVVNVLWISRGLQLVSSSADGAMKVWEIKTRLCQDTLMSHDSECKVWGLESPNDGETLVSGGEDGRIVLWRDVTEELTKEEAMETQRIQSEKQTVSNLLHAKRWEEALRFTLKYSQPHNAMKAIQGILTSTGEDSLNKVINSLEESELGSLVQYLCKWNSKASSCYEAITILNMLVCTKLPEELAKLPFWESSVEALLSYTSKHLERVVNMHQTVGLLEYACRNNNIKLIQKSEDLNDEILLSELMPESGKFEENEDDFIEGENAIESVEDLDGGFEMEKVEVSENEESDGEKSSEDNPDNFYASDDDFGYIDHRTEKKNKKMEQESRDYEAPNEDDQPSDKRRYFDAKKKESFGKKRSIVKKKPKVK